MGYTVENGVYVLDEKLSLLEKQILDDCCKHLESRGFKYLSVPSSLKWSTWERQDIKLPVAILGIDKVHCLSGSAEQGILERFADKNVKPGLFYARNQCFRNETSYQDLVRVKEFVKVEQYCFATKETWEEKFNWLLESATSFLTKLGIESHIRDVTKLDAGYHLKKYDIFIKTEAFGWIESHSCSYFGEEQSKRFNITGASHTISNTGIASPRVLIPFIEGTARLK